MTALASLQAELPGQTVSRTVSVNYLRAFFDYVQRRGLLLPVLLEGLAVDPSDREGRVAVDVCHRLFARAAQWLEDEDIGLHAGELMRLGYYGAVAYAALSCQWGREAVGYLSRYQSLAMDVGAPRIEAEGESLVIHWHTNEAWRQNRYLADYNLAGLLTCSRLVMGDDLRMVRVDMAYAAPSSRSTLQRLAGCEIRYDQAVYRLAVPLTMLDYALPEPNPEVCQAMARLAEQQLQQFSREDGFLPQLRRLLATRIAQGAVPQEEVAAALGIHVRTLQRRLGEQGLTYSQLVDEVRKTLAATYIRDPGLSLGEVAFLLGFSEQSNFQKSFKRWFGETPGRYRRQPPES